MKRYELTKVEMTKDRADHKPSPFSARSLYTFLLGNPGYYYFTSVNMVPFISVLRHVGHL